ncbi:putative Glycosyl transferase family 1 domain-containing protein [Candidatus Magnetomoraceae bacterium gMMP-1]
MDSKNILLVRNDLKTFGGAEKFLIEQAKYFKKRNYNVYVLTFIFNSKEFSELSTVANVIELENSNFVYKIFQIRKHIHKIDPYIIYAHESFYELMWLALSGTKIKYNIFSHDSLFWYENDVRIYSILYNRVFASIVNSNTGHKKFTATSFSETEIYKNKKLLFLRRLKMEFSAFLEYIGMKRAAKVYTICKRSQYELKLMYFIDSEILYPGFNTDDNNNNNNTESIELKKYPFIINNKKIIFTVNRLTKRKRIDDLIYEFIKFEKSNNDSVLVIAGKGQEYKKYKQIINENNMNNKIFLLGFINEQELLFWYKISDVVVYPQWGSWGLVPIEALYFNKKVIVSNDSGAADLKLFYDSNVFVYDVAKNDLKDVLEMAMKSKAQHTRKLTVDLFSWDVYFDQVLKDSVSCYVQHIR